MIQTPPTASPRCSFRSGMSCSATTLLASNSAGRPSHGGASSGESGSGKGSVLREGGSESRSEREGGSDTPGGLDGEREEEDGTPDAQGAGESGGAGEHVAEGGAEQEWWSNLGTGVPHRGGGDYDNGAIDRSRRQSDLLALPRASSMYSLEHCFLHIDWLAASDQI
ncbi:hypothetical protein CALVIDRAFT_228276 [Calocera viscosa TUFC12733]|uniref:Uncharacterized protein n=1 Tax=Calocera viscosa (strain TUFC12733) TaxID=1330018 RepID=A0A167K3X6_CALVF|nr:hypothetical protein CALVIDRAFT_228276 [Calocera viscosa TUFC12733]